MLSLKPPVPTGESEWESLFSPSKEFSWDVLARLGGARRALTRALLPLVLEEAPAEDTLVCAVQAADAYRARWIPFWKQQLLHPGGAVTRQPVTFRWRVDVFHDPTASVGSKEYVDPSPLAETVCATLASVVAHQRLAGASAGDRAKEHFEESERLISWTISTVLPLFRPCTRKKEPHFFSETWHEALHAAIGAHRACKTALQGSVRGDQPETTAMRLFRGAHRYQKAASLVPGERAFSLCQARAAASAYRFLAQAVADGTSHMGVAIACAEEALALAAGSAAADKHREFLATLRKRNEQEAGFQPIPPRSALRLDFAPVLQLSVLHQDSLAVCITIPLVSE